MKSVFLFLSFALNASAFSLTTDAGNRLMSKARRLNDQHNNDDSYDFSWVTDYSIKFDSCHTTLSFRAQGNSGDADGAPTESERLVLFKLCPTNKCSSCSGGAEYVVELKEFVEAYLNAQSTQKEYNCAKVKNSCSCENDDSVNDDDVCLSKCYATAGLDYCENEEDEFEVDRYLECRNLGDNKNNNGDDSTQMYVGAYCSSNLKNIYLGAFSDRQCSKKIDASAYETLTGTALPYTSKSLVSNNCISCKEPSQYDDDYNADQDDTDAVTEICEELYDRSAKCETNLKITTKSTGGCDFIHRILPGVERVVANRSGARAPVVWAWIFATTTVLAVAAAAYLLSKLRRKRGVNLSAQGGIMS